MQKISSVFLKSKEKQLVLLDVLYKGLALPSMGAQHYE
ncbi:hypothetical protein protein [Bacillus cereus G9241]|nr:hypothetical protein protein [Bacillus cereus G9241]